MDQLDEKMKEIFDVIPVEKKEPPSTNTKDTKETSVVCVPKTIEPDSSETDLLEDYNTVRNNYEEIVDTGKEALAQLLQIANDSQHPRAYEVLGQLMKVLTDTNEKMIDLQKKMREMNRGKGGDGSTKIDKAIFIGSTTELSRLLKSKED
jgi:Terminase DNA packaging enzyme